MILQWLVCLIQGILELQNSGIFHADLQFRNTIQVKDEHNSEVFKIIDFDYAFKVNNKGDPKENSLQKTKDLVKFWLNEKGLDLKMLKYFFRYYENMDIFFDSKLLSIKNSSLQEGEKI